MKQTITLVIWTGLLLFVMLLPAFMGAIARLFWKNCQRVTLATSIAILFLVLDYGLRPHQFAEMIKPMADNAFPIVLMYTMVTFIMLMQIVIMAYVANLGIRFVDKRRDSQHEPPAGTPEAGRL